MNAELREKINALIGAAASIADYLNESGNYEEDLAYIKAVKQAIDDVNEAMNKQSEQGEQGEQ